MIHMIKIQIGSLEELVSKKPLVKIPRKTVVRAIIIVKSLKTLRGKMRKRVN